VVGTFAKRLRSDDYPWAPSLEERLHTIEEVEREWGAGLDITEMAPHEDPSLLGIQIRAGLHTGECELMRDKISGIAVHTGARVAAAADPGEVLVSSTVKDLVAGSGIVFADRGERELKGVGSWRLYSVLDA
jgi:class 3 adenylate cyclase